MKKANILCVIPARGGSKRLKNKNIKLLYGKPIIAYTIEAALESRLIDKIVVSTDDEKIARVANSYDIPVIKRPREYSTDSAPIEQALRHVVKCLDRDGYFADIIVWLQANVPVRRKVMIDKVIKKLLSTDADSAVTLSCVTQYPFWMKRMNKQGFIKPLFVNIRQYQSQQVEPFYLLDGAVVAMRRKALMANPGKQGAHVYLGKKCIGIIQERKYTLEIDRKEDLELAEFYLRKL